MTHEEKRKERINSMLALLEKTGGMSVLSLVSHMSMETGASLGTCKEYLNVAVLSGRVKLTNGYASLEAPKTD